jgi:hypothetical protein
MSNDNEPKTQQEAWKRANDDRNNGYQPTNTSTWSDAARQNYLNQYHHNNTNQPK